MQLLDYIVEDLTVHAAVALETVHMNQDSTIRTVGLRLFSIKRKSTGITIFQRLRGIMFKRLSVILFRRLGLILLKSDFRTIFNSFWPTSLTWSLFYSRI